MGTLLLIVGVLLFIGLVVVHELGHFIMARRGGVTVEEFGIGFPPRLYKKRMKGGWLFTINLLPLGGFVKLKGEHDTDTEPGSFGAASVPTKVKVLAAGVVMNALVAYVLLVVLALIGMPQLIDNQFTVARNASYVQRAESYVVAGAVEQGSPAERAGIKQGDALVSILPEGSDVGEKSAGGAAYPTNVHTVRDLPELTKQYAGQTVIMQYRLGGHGSAVVKGITLRSDAEVKAAEAAGKRIGYLGVAAQEARSGVNIVRSTWSAPIVAAGAAGQFTELTFQGLGRAVAGLGGIVVNTFTGNDAARRAAQTEAASQVTGPVGIFVVFQQGSALGFRVMLFIVAILSLTLAIMNILPLPALDGGRLWLMLFTRAIRRPLSPEWEEKVNAAGFLFLLALIILVTVVDVRRFFY